MNRARDPFTIENAVDMAKKRGCCRSQRIVYDEVLKYDLRQQNGSPLFCSEMGFVELVIVTTQ